MVIATMSIAVEAGIAKIYTAAPEIDYFCYQLSPDSFSFHNIEKYFFSFTDNFFSLKSIQLLVVYVNTTEFFCIVGEIIWSTEGHSLKKT